MAKIELTAEQIQVVEQQINGEIELWNATDEQQKNLKAVINKAESLLDELDAYDDLEEAGNDLIKWFYNKYKAQQAEK